MNPDVRDILQALEDFEDTPEAAGMELRLSLSETVIRHLKKRNWSQCELAQVAGLKDSFVSRVLHSNENCTFNTAGKLLFALGIRARIEEAPIAKAITHDSTSEKIRVMRVVSESDDQKNQEISYAHTPGYAQA